MYNDDFGPEIGNAFATLLRWIFYFAEAFLAWNIAGYWASRFWSQFILMVVLFFIFDGIRTVITAILYDAIAS